MFEFLFKYPASVFSKGTFVLAGGMPSWLLGVAIFGAAAGLGFLVLRRSSARVHGLRSAAVWLLQTALAALLLLMLWHPALSVATLRPQQNIVAVVVDDSSSMATDDSGGTRRAAAVKTLNSGLLDSLSKRFQVRLYRLSDHLDRIQKLEQLNSSGQSTHIGESLKQVLADASSLPIGAVVLLTRRRRQFRRHRSRNHFRNPPPADSDSYHRIRTRDDGARRRNHRRPDAAAGAAGFATRRAGQLSSARLLRTERQNHAERRSENSRDPRGHAESRRRPSRTKPCCSTRARPG